VERNVKENGFVKNCALLLLGANILYTHAEDLQVGKKDEERG
jgi:hypothetical protein